MQGAWMCRTPGQWRQGCRHGDTASGQNFVPRERWGRTDALPHVCRQTGHCVVHAGAGRGSITGRRVKDAGLVLQNQDKKLLLKLHEKLGSISDGIGFTLIVGDFPEFFVFSLHRARVGGHESGERKLDLEICLFISFSVFLLPSFLFFLYCLHNWHISYLEHMPSWTIYMSHVVEPFVTGGCHIGQHQHTLVYHTCCTASTSFPPLVYCGHVPEEEWSHTSLFKSSLYCLITWMLQTGLKWLSVQR